MEPELRRRLQVAAVGIPVVAVVVYAGGAVFVAGLCLLSAVAMGEFVRIFSSLPGRPFMVPGIAAAALFPFAAHHVGPVAAGWLSLPLVAGLVTYGLVSRAPEERPVTGAALTALGALYIGGLLGFAVPLRTEFVTGRGAGTLLFFFPVAVTWMTDTAAFVGGRRWGRTKLAPRVSPGKTVAGAVSALLVGTAAGGGLGTGLPGLGLPITWAEGFGLGLAIALAATAGDLSESLMKRECGVKDASDLLPGHGGLLDRMDSLLWVFPVTYLYLRFLG